MSGMNSKGLSPDFIALIFFVKQMTAYEISHSGQKFPNRTILPNAQVKRQQRRLNGIGHSVEHLKFEVARTDTKPLRLRKNMRDAANVMGAKRPGHNVLVLQKE